MEEIEPEPHLYSINIIFSKLITGVISTDIIIELFVIGLLLFFSAMISGSEVAFFSLDGKKKELLHENGTKKDRQIISLLEHPKRLLATILIANNFVNIGIVILSTFIFMSLFNFVSYPVLGFIIQVVVVTLLLLIIGEIIPKVYATQYPERFAKLMCNSLNMLSIIFRPLSSILVHSTNIIDKKITKKSHEISMNELSDALDITEHDQSKEGERKILKSIVKFGDIDVSEIMTPRVDVVSIEYGTSFEKLLKIILDSGYSRLPVYKDNFDNIAGILHIKDLLPHIQGNPNYPWQDLLREAYFVPENKRINDLLREFQTKKIHLAVVVDEYGGTSGIVTLEDVVEEIVGEINDEFDTEDVDYQKINENEFVFEGKIQLNDLCKILSIEEEIFEKERGESDTLAGLILELKGEIPQRKEEIKFKNFIFKIENVDKRRIRSIRITKILNEDEKNA